MVYPIENHASNMVEQKAPSLEESKNLNIFKFVTTKEIAGINIGCILVSFIFADVFFTGLAVIITGIFLSAISSIFCNYAYAYIKKSIIIKKMRKNQHNSVRKDSNSSDSESDSETEMEEIEDNLNKESVNKESTDVQSNPDESALSGGSAASSRMYSDDYTPALPPRDKKHEDLNPANNAESILHIVQSRYDSAIETLSKGLTGAIDFSINALKDSLSFDFSMFIIHKKLMTPVMESEYKSHNDLIVDSVGKVKYTNEDIMKLRIYTALFCAMRTAKYINSREDKIKKKKGSKNSDVGKLKKDVIISKIRNHFEKYKEDFRSFEEYAVELKGYEKYFDLDGHEFTRIPENRILFLLALETFVTYNQAAYIQLA